VLDAVSVAIGGRERLCFGLITGRVAGYQAPSAPKHCSQSLAQALR
jgi:hypothetical protein